MTKTFKGELEIDHIRGVIYFHVESKWYGIKNPTMLRVCNLGKLKKEAKFIDITHMVGIEVK